MREVTGCLLAQCNVWKPLVFCRIQHGVLYHVASNLFIPYQRPAGKPCVLFGFFFSSLPHRCWSGLLTKSLNPCLPQYDSHLGGTPIRGKHDDSKERKKEITNVYHRIPCNSPPLHQPPPPLPKVTTTQSSLTPLSTFSPPSSGEHMVCPLWLRLTHNVHQPCCRHVPRCDLVCVRLWKSNPMQSGSA